MLTSKQGKQACERVMKQIKAPWHHNKDLSRSGQQVVYDVNGILVANVGSYKVSDKEDLAKCRVVEAAPFMLLTLMELQGMEYHITDPGLRAKFVDRVYSAIEKAIGK